MIAIALLITVAHFALSSLLGHYVAYQVGGSAGENIARFITETYDSKGAASEAELTERYRDMKKAIDATADRWQVTFVLLSLPIKFALEPMFRSVTRSWYDQAFADGLSLPRLRFRIRTIIVVEDLLNSIALGLLAYLGLRMAQRFHAP